MGERARINDQAEDIAIGKLIIDLIDNEALVVGLVELYLHAKCCCFLGESVFEVGQSLVSIDARFAEPEAVEVWPVNDDNTLHDVMSNDNSLTMNRASNPVARKVVSTVFLQVAGLLDERPIQIEFLGSLGRKGSHTEDFRGVVSAGV